MTRVSPAQIALGIIAVVSVIALWLLGEWLRTNQGISWSGAPSPEQLFAMAVSRLSWMLIPALAFAAAGSALGLVFAWCFRERDRDRRPVGPDTRVDAVEEVS